MVSAIWYRFGADLDRVSRAHSGAQLHASSSGGVPLFVAIGKCWSCTSPAALAKHFLSIRSGRAPLDRRDCVQESAGSTVRKLPTGNEPEPLTMLVRDDQFQVQTTSLVGSRWRECGRRQVEQVQDPRLASISDAPIECSLVTECPPPPPRTEDAGVNLLTPCTALAVFVAERMLASQRKKKPADDGKADVQARPGRKKQRRLKRRTNSEFEICTISFLKAQLETYLQRHTTFLAQGPR